MLKRFLNDETGAILSAELVVIMSLLLCAVIVGIAAMALNVALSLWLRVPLALAGLALANTIATTLEMILLLILISRRLGGLEWPQLVVMVLKSGAAALLMAVPLWWAASNLSNVPILLLAPAGLPPVWPMTSSSGGGWENTMIPRPNFMAQFPWASWRIMSRVEVARTSPP